MISAGSFLERSGQALAGARSALRFAVVQDLLEDRRSAGAGNQHEVRYRGRLLAVRSAYDAMDPQSIRSSLSAEATLGRVDAWARTGFHPAVFDYLVLELNGLPDEIDSITATLAAHHGKESSPLGTMATFLGLAYHCGVEAMAAKSGVNPGEFTDALLTSIIRRSMVHSPVFDVVQVGAPAAATYLAGSIVDILDYTYIAIHGDMAFLLGCWVNAFEMERFTTDQPEIEFYQQTPKQAIELEPAFPGLPAMLPAPPGFPGGNLGQRPLLTLQSTVYRRWEELARGPEAQRDLLRHKQRIKIGQWLEAKPQASPPAWPLRPGYLATDDDFTRKRKSIGFNANSSVQIRLDNLKQLLAGTEQTAPGKTKTVHSYMTYLHNGNKAQKVVRLNAGAYPRGGRKPPSITHDSTYGLDLDIDVPNVKQKEAAEGKLELYELENWLKIFGPGELGESFVREFVTPELSLEPDDFVPAVTFTQAILVTLPSRVLFGDPLVLIAAFGGLMDHLKTQHGDEVVGQLPGLFADPQRYLFYEPNVHWNHWHVDWVPAKALEAKAITDEWAWVAGDPKKWNIKGDFVAFNKKRKERDFQRPVPIRYADPVTCGTEEEIREVNELLVTGVDLTNADEVPAVSPFPIGAVTDLQTIESWLGVYFPEWRAPD